MLVVGDRAEWSAESVAELEVREKSQTASCELAEELVALPPTERTNPQGSRPRLRLPSAITQESLDMVAEAGAAALSLARRLQDVNDSLASWRVVREWSNAPCCEIYHAYTRVWGAEGG